MYQFDASLLIYYYYFSQKKSFNDPKLYIDNRIDFRYGASSYNVSILKLFQALKHFVVLFFLGVHHLKEHDDNNRYVLHPIVFIPYLFHLLCRAVKGFVFDYH